MTVTQKLKTYFRENLGVAAVWFGLTIPMVFSAVGLSVDIGQAYLVRERLSRALDAAALAAAASASEDASAVEQKVQDFIDANYPPEKVGFATDIEVVNGSDTLFVTAWAKLDPSFLQVFGQEYIEVKVESEVTKEVKAIEVVMVMDVTGSMSTNNNIGALRTAAKNFVQIMLCPKNLNTSSCTVDAKRKDEVKIGLVPFSSSVNVGKYGLGKKPNNTNYDTPFVNNPSNLTYSTADIAVTDVSKWGGCILESTTNYDDRDDHDGPWNMYRYCRTSAGAMVVGCDTTETRSGKKPNYTYTYAPNRNQNYLCPKTPLTPLTNNGLELMTSIGTLRADGNTYINNGLTWGLRVISPEFPFREGASWNDHDWKKAIILMTDGESTMHNFYSIYGQTKNHSIDPSDLDDRIEDVCEDLRDKGVLVYTITFDRGVSMDTKKIFERCATEKSMWYDAPTQDKLIEVYQTIAKELANIHLSK